MAGSPALVRPLRLAYWLQPIVDLATGEIAGYEWLTRGAGDAAAGPLWAWAAAAGRIAAVERQALADAARWRRAGLLPPGAIWVNLHPLGIVADPGWDPARAAAGLAPVVWECLEAPGWDPGRVRALAEAAPLAADDWAPEQADRLAAWPVRWIKTDLRLLQAAGPSGADGTRLLRITQVAAARGVGCVAEGVETPGHIQMARELGLPLAQGFALARPRRWAEVPFEREARKGGRDSG